MKLSEKILKAIYESNLPFDNWSEKDKLDLVILILELLVKDLEENGLTNNS